ncbi:hypothetical protein FNJ84_18940 [Paracoccus sp. M683]|uniref:hypothetical protein n=1 Tax=Paracoccus sp. M683 TaxID=2594268 RepID=UPI00117FE2A7|nr:hypothetical protein [Paracoccus sp. M683]TRW94572.1 hypothetical protein FNJ84_18940 [Paracoccus sp. M683]
MTHQRPAQAAGRRVALLVLGMHRSGTSALTRIISLAGAGLPRTMIPAGDGNRTGHWESSELVRTNDRIFEAFGLTWSDWQSPDLAAVSFRDRAMMESDLARVIRKEFGPDDMIVVKDPRICRLVPQYLSVFDEMDCRVVPVLAFRHPQEVILSLSARSSWPDDKSALDAALLWLVHTLEAEHETRHLDRIVVSYDRTMRDWRSVVADIEQCGQITLPNGADVIGTAVAEFLNTDERHHNKHGDFFARDTLTMGWVRSVYEAMRLLEADPASPVARAQLDDVRQQINASIPVLLLASNKLVEAQSAKRQAQAELADARQQADEAARQSQDEIAALRQQADDQMQAAQAELADVRQQADEAARQSQDEIAALRQQADDQMQAARAELTNARQQADAAARQSQAELEQGFESEREALSRQYSSALGASEARTQQLLEAKDIVYRSTTSWRVTAPLRSVGRMTKGRWKNTRGLRNAVAVLGGVRPTLAIATRVLRQQGVRGFATRLRQLKANGYQIGNSMPNGNGSSGEYVNLMAAERGDVLFSDWHVALTQAIWDDRPPEPDGATLGLSIVTHNSARWLPGFLTSLAEQNFPLSRLNVAIVDHDSQDNTIDLISAHIAEFGDL